MKHKKRNVVRNLKKLLWTLCISLLAVQLSAAEFITLGSGNADEVAWGSVTFEPNVTQAVYTTGSPDITASGIGTKYEVNDLVWEGANLKGYVVAIPDDNTITLNVNPGNGTNKTLRGRMVVTPSGQQPGAKDNVLVDAGHTLTFTSRKEYLSIQILSHASASGKIVVTDGGYLETTTSGDDNQTYTSRVYGAYNSEAQFVIEGTGEVLINGYFTLRANEAGGSSALILKDNGKITINRNFSTAANAALKMSGTAKASVYAISNGTVDCSEGGTPHISILKKFAPATFIPGQSTIETAKFSEETIMGMQNYEFYNLLVNNPVSYSWGWATNAMIRTFTILNNLTVNTVFSVSPHKWVIADGATIATDAVFGPQVGISRDGSGSLSVMRSTPLAGGQTLTIPFADGKEKYTPVILTALTPADGQTAEFNVQTTPAANGISGANSLQRTWDIKTTSVTGLSAQFFYAGNEITGDPAGYTVKLLETGSSVDLTSLNAVVDVTGKKIEITGAPGMNGILMASGTFPSEAPDGAYSKKNGNWNDASAWVWKGAGSGIPNGDDVDVYIGHTITGNQNMTVRNLTVQPGGRFNAAGNINYTVKGKADIYGIYNEEDNKNDAKTIFEGPVTIYEGAYVNTENVYGYDNGTGTGKAYDATFRTQTRTPLIFHDDLTVDGTFYCGEVCFDADNKAGKTITLRGKGKWSASGGNKRFLLGVETTVINEAEIRFAAAGTERYLQSLAEQNNSKFINKATMRTQSVVSPYDQEISTSKRGNPLSLIDVTSNENTFMFENGGNAIAPAGEYWHYKMQTNSEMYGRTFELAENLALKGNLSIKGNPLATSGLQFRANDLRIDVAGDVILENESAVFQDNSKTGCSLTAEKIINNGGTLKLPRVAVLVKADAVDTEPVMKLEGGAQFASLYFSGEGDKKVYTGDLLRVGSGGINSAQSDTSNISVSSGTLSIDGPVILSGSSRQVEWKDATNKPYIFANGGKVKITSLQINEGGTSNYPELRNVDLEVDTLKLSFNSYYTRYMFYTGQNKLTINKDFRQMNERADGASEMINAIGGEIIINGTGPLTGTLRFAPAADDAPNIRRLVLNRTSESNDSISLYDNVTVGEELQLNGQPLRFVAAKRSIDYAENATLTYGGITPQTTGIEFENAVNVKIDNPAGVKMNKVAQLGKLTLQNGVFDVNSFDLNVVQIEGTDFSTAKMIELGNQTFTTQVADKTLPIGNAGKYAPVTLSQIQAETPADITLSVMNTPYEAFTGEAIRLNKQWQVAATAGFTGKLLMQYESSDIEGTVENGKLEALYITGDNKTQLGESSGNKIEVPYQGAGIYTARYMPLYNITPVKGTADPAAAYEGEQVTITADQPEENYAFRYWVSGDVAFADSSLNVTTFTMPAKPVSMIAEYALIREITVHGGTADTTKAIIGDTVRISTHTPFGKSFVEWNSEEATFDDAGATATWFVMPDKNVALSAEFSNAIPEGKEWMLVDMENNMFDGNGYWQNWDWGGTLDKAFANPVKDGINTSETVYKYQQNDSGWGAVGFDMLVASDSVDLTGWDYIAIDVMSENEPYAGEQSYIRKGSQDEHTLAREGNLDFPAGQWSTIYFKLDNYPAEKSRNIAGFYLKPNAGTPNSIVYLDNLRLLKASSVTFAEGSENAEASQTRAAEGQLITVTTPEPETGMQFDGWEAGDLLFADSKALTTTFVMPANDVRITARYSNIIYRITTDKCTAEPAEAAMGAEITLTPGTPEPGYEFDAWEIVEGEITVTDNKFIMPPSDVSVKALYKKVNYTVTVTGGTADKATATIGETVVLTPEPPELGYEFDKWEVTAGSVTVTGNEFTMGSADVSVTAHYKKIAYTITVIGGTADKETATIGETVTLTPEIPQYLKLLRWEVLEGGITITDDNTFVMPASNVKIEAVFNVGVEDGENARLTVYPNPAAAFIRIDGLEEDASYVIIAPNGAIVLAGDSYNGEPLDIAALSAGTYIFKSGEQTLRFIKK